MLSPIFGIVAALLIVGILLALQSRLALLKQLRRSQAVTVVLLSLPAAVACQIAMQRMWLWTGLNPKAGAAADSTGLIALLLFASPLVEGAKVLCVWPLYRARRILNVRQGAALGIVVGVGFSAAEVGWELSTNGSEWAWLQALLGLPAHAACGIAWCCCLGLRGRSRWFGASWAAAMLVHGLHDHFVWGRGPGLLMLALPLLLTCVALAYASFRRALARERQLQSPDPNTATSNAVGWSEPPSVREIWVALHPRQSTLMLPWILVSTLVTAGVSLASLAGALYVGRLIGLDFAAANEADVRSNGPLLFLATAVALGFPISGYLVARASTSVGILEPALGSAIAVLGAVLLLSITTPVAAVFALAITPIAFALSSGGAWFALDR